MSVVARCDGCGREQRSLTGTWWILQSEGMKNWLKVRDREQWVGQSLPPYHFCSLACVRLFIEGQTPEALAPR